MNLGIYAVGNTKTCYYLTPGINLVYGLGETNVYHLK
jgi:hypothetical protein